MRAPMAVPQGPNQRWSLDFVSDQFGCGRRFRILTVVDDFTKECLALLTDTSLTGARVACELDLIVADRVRPATKRHRLRRAVRIRKAQASRKATGRVA